MGSSIFPGLLRRLVKSEERRSGTSPIMILARAARNAGSYVGVGVACVLVRSQSAAASSAPTNVRVASYNVLSDNLCRASHYVHSKPDDLDNVNRLERVKAKLGEEMKKGSVICLQVFIMRRGQLVFETQAQSVDNE